jgi:hypothetical protein
LGGFLAAVTGWRGAEMEKGVMPEGHETWSGITIVALVIVYLPWIASGVISFSPRGGGIWRFLTFVFCTVALAGIFFFIVPGVIAWIVAWMCAAASRSAIARSRVEDATLRAIEEQNQLLREQAATSASITGDVARYRGYTYRVAQNGEAELKLSSGAWRKFPSTQAIKAYVDAVLGRGGASNWQKLNPIWPLREDRSVASPPAVANAKTATQPAGLSVIDVVRRHLLWVASILGLVVSIVGLIMINNWLLTNSATFTMRSNMRASGSASDPAWAVVGSVGECEKKCARNAGCKTFTFGKITRTCYFYTSATLGPDPDFDSGERN